MDLTTTLLIAVFALAAIGVSAYMLNRAWGDFPGRAGRIDLGPPPAPPSSAPARVAAPADDDPGAADQPLPAGAPEDGLIPVTDPLVRRALEQALERGGGPYATYFIRDGERIYLAAYRIADPAQRAQLTRVFRGLNGGDMTGINLPEIIGAIQKLTRQ